APRGDRRRPAPGRAGLLRQPGRTAVRDRDADRTPGQLVPVGRAGTGRRLGAERRRGEDLDRGTGVGPQPPGSGARPADGARVTDRDSPMRVIEQLVQHFWARGALTRDEALYLVGHGFVREADLPGLVERPPEPETDEVEVPP